MPFISGAKCKKFDTEHRRKAMAVKAMGSEVNQPMNIRPGQIFAIIWIGWIASWFAAALWSARTEKRAPTANAWIYNAFILAGAVLRSRG